MHVTYIEIYQEQATDLLENSSNLQIRENEKGDTGLLLEHFSIHFINHWYFFSFFWFQICVKKKVDQ